MYDALGSVKALSDSTGAVTDKYNYTAFGKDLNHSGSTANNYKFAGEQYDSELDNYYLRARLYNQNIGRFTQQDTWNGKEREPLSLHKYLYANVNPVSYADPSGRMTLIDSETAENIQGELLQIARDQIRGYIEDRIFGGGGVDGPPSLWDYLMASAVKSLAMGFNDGGDLSSVTTLVQNFGPHEWHHTIPVYCCGRNKGQDRSYIPTSLHRKITKEMLLFTEAVNLAGITFKVVFHRRNKGDIRAPLQDMAEKPLGRTAIVTALTTFYTERGIMGEGSPTIGAALLKESGFFISNDRFTSLNTNCVR